MDQSCESCPLLCSVWLYIDVLEQNHVYYIGISFKIYVKLVVVQCFIPDLSQIRISSWGLAMSSNRNDFRLPDWRHQRNWIHGIPWFLSFHNFWTPVYAKLVNITGHFPGFYGNSMSIPPVEVMNPPTSRGPHGPRRPHTSTGSMRMSARRLEHGCQENLRFGNGL